MARDEPFRAMTLSFAVTTLPVPFLREVVAPAQKSVICQGDVRVLLRLSGGTVGMDRVARSPHAIFLHSGFRSGSTWVWSRFRASDQCYCYYEPFNEVLSELRAADIATFTTASWASGHPEHLAPYFEEYRPLLSAAGGAAGFRPEFCYGLYYHLAPYPPQQAYIEGLIQHARDQGGVPVLGFCRSFGRVPWLREYFDAYHIVTLRNAWDRWLSFETRLGDQNDRYFHYATYITAAVGHYGGVYGGFLCDLPLPDMVNTAPGARGETLSSHFRSLDATQRCRIFLRVFILDMLIALPCADYVLDVDRMTWEASYRQRVTDELRHRTGLTDLSFVGCRLPSHTVEHPFWTDAVARESAFLQRFVANCNQPPAPAVIDATVRMLHPVGRHAAVGSASPAFSDMVFH